MAHSITEQLDALKVRMIVGCNPAESLQALAAFESSAREGGKLSAANAAAELASRAANLTGDAFELAFTEGLENLRRALESVPATKSLAEDPELITEFVNEAAEHLSSIETQILALERDPNSQDPLHAAFRSFHTIKGLAGFLELTDIRAVAHEVETLLDRARNHLLTITPGLIDVVLESADYLKRATAWVFARLSGTEGVPPPIVELIGRLQAALEEAPLESAPVEAPAIEVKSSEAAPEATPDVVAAVNTPAAATVQSSANEVGLTLRVDATKLDFLLDMVGEMVIAHSMVVHSPEWDNSANGVLQRNLQQLGRITGDLQRLAMSLRMTPMGQLYGRMTRLVRDLTRKNGKRVRMDFSGDEIELDKTIVEQLVDPLMHMVRNSLDHGLELPDERIAAGKSPEGCLTLAASHQAGHIILQVSDDGRGLNTEKILKKARDRNLISEGQNLSDSDIFHLIFEPGFSTAEQVTDVSGRGVGMDVVRRQIQTLRGHIEIQSKPGIGTTFLLRLPLTLAIIDGLIVGVGEERYILPISSVREMLRPRPDMLFTMEGRAEMAMVREEMLPVIRLDRRFGVPGAVQNPSDALFVVAECEGRRFCLLVDKLIGKQEVVIKNLGDTFRHVAEISGGAILGDGRVGLILDVNGVCKNAARKDLAHV